MSAGQPMGYVATPLRLPQHREALAALWADNMSDGRIAAMTSARMRWLYEDAPEGRATTVLVLSEESGAAVGCGSLLPRRMWVGGRHVAGGVLCDFAVARAHRNAGAALTIQRALVEAGRAAGLELLFGYPNDKSLAVFKRIGYRVVGRTTTWVKPLRSGYKLRQLLRWPGAAPLLVPPVDLSLRLVDAVRRLRRPSVDGVVLASADGRGDALWERARAAHGVTGERSDAYLDWRYRRFPTSNHTILGAVGRGADRLTGYGVFAIEDGKAFVRDLLAEPDPAALEALLLALSAHLRRCGADSVSLSYLGPPELGERLAAVGFLRRAGERSLVVHPDAVPEDLRPSVLDPARWFMLDGELDI